MPFLDDVSAAPAATPKTSGFLDVITPDDVRARLASEPNPTVSRQDAEILYNESQNTPARVKAQQAVGAAFQAIPNVIGNLGKNIGEGVAQAYGAYTDKGRSAAEVGAGLGLTALEGVGRGTLDLGQQATRAQNRLHDAAVPANVKRMMLQLQETAPEGAAPIPTPQVDPIAQLQQRLQQNVTWDRMRQDMASGKQGGWIDPTGSLTQNGLLYPGLSEATSNVADASALVPGAGILAKGAAKSLGMETLAKSIAEKTANRAAEQTLGKVAESAGKVYEIAKKPVQMTQDVVEAALPGSGLANEAKGIVGMATGPVLAPAKTIERLARVGQQLARTTGDSSLTRFEQLAASPTAPEWIRTAGRYLAATGAEGIAKTVKKAAASGATGMGMGLVVGGPGAETPEELGSAVGGGATLAGLTHVALMHTGSEAEKQIAQNYDIARMWSQKSDSERAAITSAARPWSRETFLHLASAEAAANGILDPQSVVQFQVMPEADYAKATGAGETRAAFQVAGDKPTIFINADRFADGTAWHELGHAFMASKDITDSAAITQRLFGVYDQTGKQVAPGLLPDGEFIQRGQQYLDRFPQGSPVRTQMEALRSGYVQNPMSPEGSQWLKLISGEAVSELFANLARSTGGNLLTESIQPGRALVDKALLSENPLAQKLGGIGDKLLGGAQRGESDILPGLKNTPEIDALLRQQIRNRYKGEGFPEFSSDQPTKSVNPREVLKPGGDQILKEFEANDNFAKNPDGSVMKGAGGAPVLLSESQIKKLQKAREEAVRDSLNKVAASDPDAAQPGIVRPKLNPDGTPSDNLSGTKLTPAQIGAIDAIPANVLPPKLKQWIHTLNDGGPGQVFWLNYNSATKSGRYSSRIAASERLFSLMDFNTSKAGNFFVHAIDLTAMNAKLANWLHTPSKRRAFVDFNNDPNQFMQGVYKVLANHAQRVEGATGLDADPAKARRMAERIFDFINIRDLDSEGLIADRMSAREGKQGEKDKLIKSFRLDRMNDVQVRPGEKFAVDYPLQKAAFSPDEFEPTREQLSDAGIRPDEWAKMGEADKKELREYFKARAYFDIGHDSPKDGQPSPGAKAWVWKDGRLQTAPGSQTHGMAFSHAYDRFKGRYDKEKNIISFVDDKQEVKSEDDLPQQVYKALKSKFPKDAKILFFSPEGEKDANATLKDERNMLGMAKYAAKPEEGLKVTGNNLSEASQKLNHESGQYSQLERVIDQKVQGQSIPAAQLAAMLRNPQSGVKAEEIKWTGLDDFLKGKERVTKSELLDFVRANRLQIEEKRLGEKTQESAAKWTQEGDSFTYETPEKHLGQITLAEENNLRPLEGWERFSVTVPGHGQRYFETLQAAKEWAEHVNKDRSTVNPTKYGGRNLESPGGENYREILFRFPDTTQVKDRGAFDLGKDHWNHDQRNFAHTRVQDYDNGKTLLIDEIQSDWHQQGRQKGYDISEPEFNRLVAEKTAAYREQIETAKINYEKAYNTLSEDWLKYIVPPLKEKIIARLKQTIPELNVGLVREIPLHEFKDRLPLTEDEMNLVDSEVERGNRLGVEVSAAHSRLKAAQEALRSVQGQVRAETGFGRKVSEAPFAKTWHEFVFKRMLRDAVEKGYDAIEWPDGATIAKRFDLAQHIDYLDYYQNTNGQWRVKTNQGEWVIKDDELNAHVGEGVAERMRRGAGEPLGEDQTWTRLDTEGMGDVDGPEARGMKSFYDSMLPAFVNKYVKKWGGKVEDTVRGRIEQPVWENADGAWWFDAKNAVEREMWRVVPEDGQFEIFKNSDFVGNQPTLDAAKKFVEDRGSPEDTSFPVHRVEITQPMRQEIASKGQTLFSPDVTPPTPSGDEPGIKNAWVSPSGDIHPIGPYPTHDVWATVATKSSGSVDASRELYKRGWVRLVHYGEDAAMANTEAGRRLTPRQRRAIIDAAIESGKSKVWFDNQNSYHVVWSRD